MKVGCHISIRRGYLQAARTASAIGADAFQYFPKNPRSLAVKEFDRRDAEACAAFCAENRIVSIAHTPYPVNMAHPHSALRDATVASLRNDLEIAEACGSVGIVVHFGKSKETDPLQGYKNIIQCMNEVLSGWKGSTLLLLENQAGEGGPMGTTLEELISVRKLAEHPEKIGFCLDTCHLFASGVWRKGESAAWMDNGARLGFFEHLKAVHLNDSVYPSGSCKDRHANIGQGYIGLEDIRTFLGGLGGTGLPVVLETGSGPDGTHRSEIGLVRSLFPK
ncbi:deoxyribonuclease IV [Gorillibacterium sp. sgz5001074]|uniref:deoxyribonuclease IV n=1 Tax=Gorillibacterium sp. sgz5001074 TaxID=3446695 RepID=UPI003F66530F